MKKKMPKKEFLARSHVRWTPVVGDLHELEVSTYVAGFEACKKLVKELQFIKLSKIRSEAVDQIGEEDSEYGWG